MNESVDNSIKDFISFRHPSPPPVAIEHHDLQTTGGCSIMYRYKQDCHVSFTPLPELHPNY